MFRPSLCILVRLNWPNIRHELWTHKEIPTIILIGMCGAKSPSLFWPSNDSQISRFFYKPLSKIFPPGPEHGQPNQFSAADTHHHLRLYCPPPSPPPPLTGHMISQVTWSHKSQWDLIMVTLIKVHLSITYSSQISWKHKLKHLDSPSDDPATSWQPMSASDTMFSPGKKGLGYFIYSHFTMAVSLRNCQI